MRKAWRVVASFAAALAAIVILVVGMNALGYRPSQSLGGIIGCVAFFLVWYWVAKKPATD